MERRLNINVYANIALLTPEIKGNYANYLKSGISTSTIPNLIRGFTFLSSSLNKYKAGQDKDEEPGASSPESF